MEDIYYKRKTLSEPQNPIQLGNGLILEVQIGWSIAPTEKSGRGHKGSELTQTYVLEDAM